MASFLPARQLIQERRCVCVDLNQCTNGKAKPGQWRGFGECLMSHQRRRLRIGYRLEADMLVSTHSHNMYMYQQYLA